MIKKGSRWMQKENNKVVLRVIEDEDPKYDVIWVREENGDYWLSFISKKSLVKYYDEIK